MRFLLFACVIWSLVIVRQPEFSTAANLFLCVTFAILLAMDVLALVTKVMAALGRSSEKETQSKKQPATGNH